MLKDKTAERIIRGVSVGIGLFLTWLIYRKDNRSLMEKRKIMKIGELGDVRAALLRL